MSFVDYTESYVVRKASKLADIIKSVLLPEDNLCPQIDGENV